MSNRPIVLSAAYGMGNIGDEAICGTLIGDIFAADPAARVVVLAWKPSVWKKANPAFAADPRVRVRQCFFVPAQLKSVAALAGMLRSIFIIARCRAFVWGGGGIVRDRTYWLKGYLRSLRTALLFRRPVIVLTIGVDRIANPEVRRMLGVLAKVPTVVVRDEESRRNLTEAVPGLASVAVVRDPVFHYPAVDRIPAKDTVIALNLCNRDGANVMDDPFREFAERLAEVLRRLHAEKQIVLRGVPTDPRDALFILHVASLVPSIPFSIADPVSPGSYVESLRDCALLIGMRMHGIILGSRVRGLPAIGFRYSAKTEELFVSAKKTDLFFPFDASDVSAVADRCASLLKTGDAEPYFADFERDSLRIAQFLKP